MHVILKEPRRHLGHYLRLVRAGEALEVTDRGRPVGWIVPADASVDDRLRAMAALGLLTRAEGRLPPRAPVALMSGGRTLADLIAEQREAPWPGR